MLHFNLHAFFLPVLSFMHMWSDSIPEEKTGLYFFFSKDYVSLFSPKNWPAYLLLSPVLCMNVIVSPTALKYCAIWNPVISVLNPFSVTSKNL